MNMPTNGVHEAAPADALPAAGVEYLRSVLSTEHAGASERRTLLNAVPLYSSIISACSCGTTLNLMAAAVTGPTMPSTRSPGVRLWNSLTAASVSGPKTPSITRSAAYSGYAFLSRRWSSATCGPSEPRKRSTSAY